MQWFSRKTTDDGQSAVDRLTEKASVSLSRRSFLKKAGVGAAVAGLGVVGMAKGSSVAHADGGTGCSGSWQPSGTCSSSNTCINCSGGRQNKKTYQIRYKCSNSTATYCGPVITEYGTCGVCLL